jgi:hypothetical protein
MRSSAARATSWRIGTRLPRESFTVHLDPNPTPLTSLIRSEGTVPMIRNLYCLHYDACLDVAVKLDWDSWSCEKCPLFTVHEGPREHAGHFAHDRRGQHH